MIHQIFLSICFGFIIIERFTESTKFSISAIQDGFLTVPELIHKYGYKVETHYVRTNDGYILCLHRIPKRKGQPFLLQHGLMDSSAGYILTGPTKALGYFLSDLGYDVWLGNSRGNRYSRNHTILNPDVNNEFWDFSWNEIGIYDIPAMIDYILMKTKFKKLYYAGHSQGTTAFFVMCSKRPEYNSKIILMHALAPGAFMNHLQSPVQPLINAIIKMPFSELYLEFLPSRRNVLIPLCQNLEDACTTSLFLVAGFNPQQFNKSLLPTINGHVPAGCATKQVRHYHQLFVSGRFCEYDYGTKLNLEKYKSQYPPSYNFTKITAPIALHYSLNDYLASVIDVKRLIKELPNIYGIFEVQSKTWNHLDFLWAIDSRKVIYTLIEKLNLEFAQKNMKTE